MMLASLSIIYYLFIYLKGLICFFSVQDLDSARIEVGRLGSSSVFFALQHSVVVLFFLTYPLYISDTTGWTGSSSLIFCFMIAFVTP